MVKRFTRKEIRDKFHAEISKGNALLATGAGAGLVAKMAEMANVDLIMAYNTGVFRMDGAHSTLGLLPYGDANQMTMDLGRRILPRIKNTPVIAGIGANDPYRDVFRLIDQVLDMGFSGITNVPTSGGQPQLCASLDEFDIGYKGDVRMISHCNKKDIFTVAYAWTEDQVRAMVAAGVDVVSPHCGQTAGGLLGSEHPISLDEGVEKTQRMYEVAVKENPDVFVFIHGGPFWNAETTQYAFSHTKAHGFIGAGCIERIPIEDAIYKTIRGFKELHLR